ncbi:unnamed protein product [Spodoptera littoralis]|uniref:Uncharacterized protein n=1 Tax=Spodoptera littoralis TaxID=7109 RepID=A0A9P0N1G9_SPOLI|nr:unnamed protein product [Spodoptera littoralis]
MVYFVSRFKVLLLLCALQISSNKTEKISVNGLPNVGIISAFLEQFIKPYIESIHHDNKDKPRTVEESKVDKAIRLKMSQLKPLLEDGQCNCDASRQADTKNETENNLTLNGNNETTIIEFVSDRRSKDRSSLRENKQELDPFQRNMKRYKALRYIIKQALDKENAANSTKTLITRTLDEMIAMLIERQCTWKSVDTTGLNNRIFNHPKNIRRSMKYLQKLSNKEWMSLRTQYLNFLRFTNDQKNSFIKQFHEFFSSVINNTWDLTKYRVRCQLIKLDDKPQKGSLGIRNKNIVKETTQCDTINVCVCEDELKYFLKNFHSHLNDTAVSVFKDYSAMYIRDFTGEIEIDKDIVGSTLDTLSKTAAKKVCKIYRKQLENFTLDEEKEKKANLDNINNFIKSTKGEVKTALLQIVDYELSAMKTKLFKTVKDDLVVNLKADLDNMQTQYTEKVCSLFASCNGKSIAGAPVAARRVDDSHWKFKPKDVDNVYVKVQLSLDDEFKDSLASIAKIRRWEGKDLTHRSNRGLPVRLEEFRQTNLSVTRTTLSSTTWLEMTSAKILAHKHPTTKTTGFKVTRTATPKNTLIAHHATKRKHSRRKDNINEVYKK